MEELLFIVIAFYILFRVFGKNVKVYHYNNFYTNNTEKPSPKKEGKITIDKKDTSKGNRSSDEGDFIDYEEVK